MSEQMDTSTDDINITDLPLNRLQRSRLIKTQTSMALEEMIPEDDQQVDVEDVNCPNCGASGDDLNVLNPGLIQCEDSDCRVYQFGT